MGIQKHLKIAWEEASSMPDEEEVTLQNPLYTKQTKNYEIEDTKIINEWYFKRDMVHKQPNPTFRSIVALVAIFTASLIIVTLRYIPPSSRTLPQQLCSYEESHECPAYELFMNAEIHEVATAILMQTGRGLFSTADRDVVRAMVSEGFRNISVQFRNGAPELADMLGTVQINGVQKEAVLEQLRLVGDPRLQDIGFEIAQAIRESGHTNSVIEMIADTEHVKGSIERKLYARREEIWALRKELVSEALLEFWGEGYEWIVTLHPENVEMMETVNGEWMDVIAEKHSVLANAHVSTFQQALAMFGGVLGVGRALLDMVADHAHMLGNDLSLPYLVTALSNDRHLNTKRLSCNLGSADFFLMAILCPLKFGMQGMDALRAAPELMRINPAKARMNNSVTRSPQGNLQKVERIETQKLLTPLRQCTYAKSAKCPAFELLLNPWIHDVATGVLMRAGNGLFHVDDHKILRGLVKEGFQNISIGLRQNHPNVAEALNSIQIGKKDIDVVLNLMQIMDDPRLQSIGFDVAQAIHKAANTNLSMDASTRRSYIKYHIEQTLFPHRAKISWLRNELIHAPLHEFLGEGNQWSMTLQPDNIRIMETIGVGWINVIDEHHQQFQVQLRKTAHVKEPMTDLFNIPQNNFGIFGGVLEQSRALLDIIKIHAHSVSNDLDIPQLVFADKGNTEVVSCDLAEGKPALWFLKAILCPLKLGIQGIDALRAASDIMKFSSTNETNNIATTI